MKKFSFVSVLLIATFLLTACGTPAAAPASSDKPPLRIAVNLWPGVYPAAIAQEQGIFAKHNVDIDLVYYADYAQTYADLVAGKIDGLSVIVGDVLLISNQKQLNFVFAVDASDGADQFIVNSDIQSATDLKGKRIGVDFGTYGDLFVRTLLEQNGIGITEVTLVNISPDNAAAAFPSDVDAVHTYEPYATETVNKGGHILFTSTETPNLVLGVMTFPTTLVQDRPEDIQAFTDAWFEAVDWMNANPDETPAVVAKGFGLTPEDIWSGGVKVFTSAESKALMQPGDDSSSAYFITQQYIDLLVTSGALSNTPKIESLINPSFFK